MTTHTTDVDDVFNGLANPTRRAVLERLSQGPASVGTLAEPFDMALPSFLQHIGVLESCRLVRSRKVGRVRVVELVPETLDRTGSWLAAQRRQWLQRMDRFDAYVTTLEDEE